MPSFSAASATLNRSASLIASLLNSAVYFLFSFGVGFLLMDHLWSKFTQFLRCPIFAEGITVCHHYSRDRKLLYVVVNHRLILHIEMTGGFVHKQYARFTIECSRQYNALLLTAT